MCLHLSICLSVSLSLYFSCFLYHIPLSFYLSASIYLPLFVLMFLSSSLRLSISLSISCLSIYLFINLQLSLSRYLSNNTSLCRTMPQCLHTYVSSYVSLSASFLCLYHLPYFSLCLQVCLYNPFHCLSVFFVSLTLVMSTYIFLPSFILIPLTPLCNFVSLFVSMYLHLFRFSPFQPLSLSATLLKSIVCCKSYCCHEILYFQP